MSWSISGSRPAPVAPSNGDFAIADVFGVDFIGTCGHVGPGVASFAIRGERLRSGRGIASQFVN